MNAPTQFSTVMPTPTTGSGAGYRPAPVAVQGTPRQGYAPGPGPGYQPAHLQNQPAMYQQQQQQPQPQQRYPQGYVQQQPHPGMPVPMQMVPQQGYAQAQQQQQQAYYAQQQAAAAHHQQRRQHQQHKGTIPPGQMVRVGSHTVRVERYLSEGGYAHVYLTTSEAPIYPPKHGASTSGKARWGERGYTEHCLKRIAFEDEKVWADVSKEIEVMKSLPPSPHLIQYLDSSHHRLPNGTHEVFILMEYCSGGGIIDLLNKRLRDRLKEIEILNIFTDVCEAVAAMHALPRPLLHRDLKIENVLSHPNGRSPMPGRPTPLIFKLCDFGSTTFPALQPPQTKAEADALAMDLNKHTTLQYRSPEMVEPMLGWPVGLPSDVWALGVLLYKLCYYTTPFEEHGTLAIVNAKYIFPAYPVYSPRLQHLIASMLVEHPSRRPAVFDVLRTAHDMSGTKPLVDYPSPSRGLPATIPTSPVKQHRTQPPKTNVLDFTTGSPPPPSLPEPSLASTVTPQRRGRPTKLQPPPPQLPTQTVATTTPAPIPIKPGRHEPFRHSHVPSSSLPLAGARPNRLQVTGDSPTPPAPQHAATHPTTAPPKPQPASKPSYGKLSTGAVAAAAQKFGSTSRQSSLDAFGAPKSGGGVTSPGGFQDSFGTAPSPKSDGNGQSPGGFGDSFSGASGATPSVTSPGVTSSSETSSVRDAFGVSLKPTSTRSPMPAGFDNSFTGSSKFAHAPPPSLPSGFSDSFSGKVLGATRPTSMAASASTSRPSSKQTSPTSPRETKRISPVPTVSTTDGLRSPGATSSMATIPTGELTFEQRFPSLEELQDEPSSTTTKEKHEREQSAPPPSVPPKAVVSTATKHIRRPSLVIPNRTGGDLAPSIRSPRVSLQHLPPQPRSTHVTGTAFKSTNPTLNVQEGRESSSASASATADYLSLLDGEVAESQPVPEAVVDLMGDEESESIRVALAPLRPVLSKSPAPGSRFGVQPEPKPQPKGQPQMHKPSVAPKPEIFSLKPDTTPGKPQGAAQRATLPPISAERPATNMNSAQWSPLERMRTASFSSGGKKSPDSPTHGAKRLLHVDTDSSDDEAGPEAANGSNRRPSSPVRRAPPSPDIARRMSWFEPGTPRSTSPQHAANAGSPDPVPAPGRGSRPQSMFVSGSNSPLSPPATGTRSPMEEGAGHSRRGSINDIVSRYEALSTRRPVHAPKPSGLTGNHTGGASAGAGAHKAPPPSVPSKPQTLRRPSGGRPMPTTSASSGGAGMGASPGAGATDASGLRRASTMGARPAPQPKPAALQVRREPDTHVHPPPDPVVPGLPAPAHVATPAPLSTVPPRGASLAAIKQPQPQGQPPVSQRPKLAHRQSATSASSRASSPEKQQPVNLLIARWNKGQV